MAFDLYLTKTPAATAYLLQMCDGYTYTACGLTFRSNRALPDLMPADADAPIDVRVDLMLEEEPRPPSAEVEKLLSGAQVLSKADGTYFHLWFRGDGQLDFEIDAKGTHISATWTLSVIEEVTALLLGQVPSVASSGYGASFACMRAR